MNVFLEAFQRISSKFGILAAVIFGIGFVIVLGTAFIAFLKNLSK